LGIELFFLPLLLFAIFIGGLAYERVYRMAERTENQVIPFLRPVDLDELESVLNFGDEGVLRLNLAPQQFRKEQKNRINFAREHFGRMSHNALYLQEWARYINRRSLATRDRAARSLSQEMIELCIQLRIAMMAARFKLNLWLIRIIVLRFMPIPAMGEVRRIGYCDLVVSYKSIKDLADRLRQIGGGNQNQMLSQLL
jgi:hypothetical protein